MEVSQRFIDLLNLSVGALGRLGDQLGVEFAPGTRKWDMARALSQTTRDELEAGAQGLYAGRTSLSWFRLGPAGEELDEDNPATFYSLGGTAADVSAVRAALSESSEADPFDERSRPDDITRSPKLVVAHERADGIMMTFAVAKRAGHVIHNFESVEVIEDEFFGALYRPDHGTFEVRASASRAGRLYQDWLIDFAKHLDLQPVPVAITPSDVRALHDHLDARLDVYRGRDATGASVFDTATFSKSERVDDLYDQDEFNEATASLEPLGYDLLFEHDGSDQIRLQLSTFQGSAFVNSTVPEVTLEYVYNALVTVKS